MSTIRELILQDLVTQLETLSGYGSIHRGKTFFVYADLPCISLLPGVETSERRYGKQVGIWPVTVHAIQAQGDLNVSVLAETMLGDLISTVISGRGNINRIEDIAYTGGGVEDWPAEDEQALSVQANFEIQYKTILGDPESQ